MKLIRKAIDAILARADEARARTRARDLARKPHIIGMGRGACAPTLFACIGPDRRYAIGFSKEQAFANWKSGESAHLNRSRVMREMLEQRRVRRFQP